MRAPLRLATTAKVAAAPALPKPILSREPLRLTPIPWGTRDPALARGICRHILDVMPPMKIAFDPRTHSRMRRDLRSHGIHH